MKPPIKSRYTLNELITSRWSPRAFDASAISDDEILTLLEAARWSASCFNDQPWRFIYANRADKSAFKVALDGLLDGNKVWAKQASAIIITLVKKNFKHNDKPNRHAQHDLGLAIGNLTVQATSMGWYVHQMAGINVAEIRETYNIPEEYDVMSAIAVGKKGNKEDLPEQLASKEYLPQQRIPLEDLIWKGN